MPKKYISENAELMKEWDWEANTKEGLDPTQLTIGSNKKAHWVCSKGHKWKREIYGRSFGYGCPYCSRLKVWAGDNDLATTHPELLKEWDYEKNTIKPTEISARSNRKIWWKCLKGHSYDATPAKRTIGQGCPYCSNKKVLVGENDLATTHPDLAKEWHPTKNGNLKPTDVVAGSARKVWWKCPKGHEYQAKVCARSVLHNGCAKCKEGNQTSFPEQAIYYYVQQVFPDAINRYRDIFDNGMELDIFIPSKKVAIEYDGSFYHKKERSLKREKIKYNICRQYKITLIRICAKNNADLFNATADYTIEEPALDDSDNTQRLDNIIKELLWMLESDFGLNPRKQYIRYNGMLIRKISADVNIERDRYKINAYRENATFKKSLAQVRPDLAAEWDYEKNQGLTPNMFPVGSREEVWWICKECGTSYPKRIYIRHIRKKTCPQCNIKCKSKQYKLYMCDAKTSKILKVFDLISEAAKETGICDSNIAGACRGTRKTAGGYIWKKEYVNKYDK